MSENICLVKAYGGEFDDAYEYNIKAFRDDVEAELFIQELVLRRERYNAMAKDNGWIWRQPQDCGDDHEAWKMQKAEYVEERTRRLTADGHEASVIALLGDSWFPPRQINDQYDVEVIELV